ncbi:hypothetical protein [Paraburkholderia nodosa]|uniref:hypothetical protein n=1 Tax=Paraburkholderia nodosa TaxID=392320 RepID=UPI0004890975|nr:hypothetical protein [Paraburkholderia nodosa]
MNTLNVCIGHVPFPAEHAHFVDLLISPNAVPGNIRRKAIVPDELYGEHGHALSEYAQLFWLFRSLDSIASGYEYLNIFQYRRFISPTPVNAPKASNLPWASVVQEVELGNYAYCFERQRANSCFNTPITLGAAGVIAQYHGAHVLEDFLSFTQYMMDEKLFDSSDALKFISQQHFVPSCSIGLYHVDLFRSIFAVLECASKFMNSPRFVARDGYQRRSVGFLLERLHSYLIVEHFRNAGVFGHNMLISDSAVATHTADRVQ